MERKQTSNSGLTLVELMIVVVIVGILASVAYPSYLEQIRKGKRSEAKGALHELANMLEQERYDRGRYNDPLSTVANVYGSTATRPEGLYTLSIIAAGSNTYTLQAAPTFDDPKCGKFTLTHTGARAVDGSNTATYCW